MDFLKAILGDELFGQVKQKIDQHNGDEKNKENPIKIGNLGGGEYVSKAKHDSLQSALDGKNSELTKANELIAELKKGTKNDDELQGKIKGYETQVANLQEELKDTKIKAAVKVALLAEKAVDVDYLTFKMSEKLKEDGKSLELDENENIKGWDDMIAGLKTQFPTQFDTSDGGEHGKKIEENKLQKSEGDNKLTREELLKKPYAERMELYHTDPEAYKAAMEK